jgi:maleate isomerase
VTFASPLGVTGGQHNIRPGDAYQWMLANVPDDTDGIFFAGNGLRVVGMIDRLERDLQRPVLSANQVLLWAALHAAGVTDTPVVGYGKLLADNPACAATD